MLDFVQYLEPNQSGVELEEIQKLKMKSIMDLTVPHLLTGHTPTLVLESTIEYIIGAAQFQDLNTVKKTVISETYSFTVEETKKEDMLK